LPQIFFFVTVKYGHFDTGKTAFFKPYLLKAEDSILRAIAYFDVFRYPVTANEIFLFMNQPVTHTVLSAGLEGLVGEKKIFQLGDYYSLQEQPELAERRLRGNERATALLRIADKIGRFLYRFPFVRGVGISGSLSKNYADIDADIDFFIITSRNHLWIARTFLHGLKKLSFLVGRQHWYCMNYFIDEEALVIAEKNIFTATEVVTLKPVCGENGLQSFYRANDWAMAHFPNHPAILFTETGRRESIIKTWTEKVFNNRLGDRLDNFLMRVTAKRWAEKEKKHKLNSKGNPLGLIAGKHFARPNPEHFQKKILGSIGHRLNTIEQAGNEGQATFISSAAK
jgi:hypothetical protein